MKPNDEFKKLKDFFKGEQRDRFESNLEILRLLSKYLQANPDQRFGQALRNIGVVETIHNSQTENNVGYFSNEFYTESTETLKKVQNRMETYGL